jgi:hypothetical protein
MVRRGTVSQRGRAKARSATVNAEPRLPIDLNADVRASLAERGTWKGIRSEG